MCTNPTLRSQAPACLLHLGLPWRRGPKMNKSVDNGPDNSATQPASKQASKHTSICFTRAEKPATRSDLHNSGTPLPPNPGRLASAISNSCTSVVPRSTHGCPTVVHRHGRCAETTHHGNRTRQQRMPARRPSAHFDVYQIRDCLCFPRLCNTKDCSGTCKPPRRGTHGGPLLLIPLLRTPTETTLSYHILCPSRAITHTPGGRTTARHTFPGLFLIAPCQCRRPDPRAAARGGKE